MPSSRARPRRYPFLSRSEMQTRAGAVAAGDKGVFHEQTVVLARKRGHGVRHRRTSNSISRHSGRQLQRAGRAAIYCPSATEHRQVPPSALNPRPNLEGREGSVWECELPRGFVQADWKAFDSSTSQTTPGLRISFRRDLSDLNQSRSVQRIIRSPERCCVTLRGLGAFRTLRRNHVSTFESLLGEFCDEVVERAAGKGPERATHWSLSESGVLDEPPLSLGSAICSLSVQSLLEAERGLLGVARSRAWKAQVPSGREFLGLLLLTAIARQTRSLAS